MLVLELFIWWYTKGWKATAQSIGNMLGGVSRLFSIPILARTLFAPWKRIISYPGASFDAKLRAYGDNLVSRAIGFVVRSLVLITALILALLAAVGGIIGTVLWPFIPPLAAILIIRGIV